MLSIKKIGYGWILVWIMFIGTVINYLDRSNLTFAATTIEKEFNLTPLGLGNLLSAFLLPYSIANLVAGTIVDRFGVKKVFISSLVLWSLATVAVSFTTDFSQMYAARVLLGVFEAPYFACMTIVAQQWFSSKRIGTALAVCNVAPQFAGVVAPLLITPLIVYFGWRAMFVILGAAGVVVAASMFFAHRLPNAEEVRKYDLAERAQALKPRVKPTAADYLGLFKNRIMWVMITGNFGLMAVKWVYLTWLPTYFEKTFHVGLMKAGVLTMIPSLAGMAGAYCGGYISDALIARGVAPVNARKSVLIGSAVGAAIFVFPINYMDNMSVIVVLLTIAYYFNTCPNGVTWALATDVAPVKLTGTVACVQNFGGYLGGYCAPIVVGLVFQTTHSFNMVFILSAVVLVISAIIYALFLKNETMELPDAKPALAAG